MEVSDLVTIDPEILGGTPVFKGTRVPVKSLFDYLEDDYTLEEFLECFPTVSRETARKFLETAQAAIRRDAARASKLLAEYRDGRLKTISHDKVKKSLGI
jgi:uncharacterized protein (DUF433 family)